MSPQHYISEHSGCVLHSNMDAQRGSGAACVFGIQLATA